MIYNTRTDKALGMQIPCTLLRAVRLRGGGTAASVLKADDVEARSLRVDGGMARNDTFLQRLADLTGIETVRPASVEATAWGAAFLAGLGCGLFASLEDGRKLWAADQSFTPAGDPDRRAADRKGWHEAVARVRSDAV